MNINIVTINRQGWYLISRANLQENATALQNAVALIILIIDIVLCVYVVYFQSILNMINVYGKYIFSILGFGGEW